MGAMERAVYNARAFRDLPRDLCVVAFLLGPAAGDCDGEIHRHHVDPHDPSFPSIPVCMKHHHRLHELLRSLSRGARRRARQASTAETLEQALGQLEKGR